MDRSNAIFRLVQSLLSDKKELKAIHEFLADEYAVSNSDEYAYAELLVLFAPSYEKQNKLVHPFFHNTIKRRIAMITNLKTRKLVTGDV